jgi:hypothetical protein
MLRLLSQEESNARLIDLLGMSKECMKDFFLSRTFNTLTKGEKEKLIMIPSST